MGRRSVEQAHVACGYTCQGRIERRAGVQAGWANHLGRCSVVADSLNS
jgi:hypothetical protein